MAPRFQTGGGNQTSLVRGVWMKDDKNTLNKVWYNMTSLSTWMNLFGSNQNQRKHHRVLQTSQLPEFIRFSNGIKILFMKNRLGHNAIWCAPLFLWGLSKHRKSKSMSVTWCFAPSQPVQLYQGRVLKSITKTKLFSIGYYLSKYLGKLISFGDSIYNFQFSSLLVFEWNRANIWYVHLIKPRMHSDTKSRHLQSIWSN